MAHLSRKAVVIDDEIRISDMVKLLLTRLGFKVWCAADGKQGLSLVEQTKPDLLVTDMLLPKIHGLDILKAARRNPSLSHTRIVAMTAIYKKLKFRLEARDVRVDAYVEKPFDVMEFSNVIQRIFPDNGNMAEVEAHVELVQKKIKEQAVSFTSTLPGTLNAIKGLWGQYRVDQENPGDLEELLKFVHRLTGSAALFGHGEVSRTCSQLEKILSDIEENGGAIIKSQQAEISSLLSRLSEAAGEATTLNSTSKALSGRVSAQSEQYHWNPETPVTIVSMNPHKLEELVYGLTSFGYKPELIRFGDLGRREFSPGGVNVIVDLRQRPTGAAWMRKLNVCGAHELLNVVAMGDEQNLKPGTGAKGCEQLCWKWVQSSADAYNVIRKLEENLTPSLPEGPYRLLIVLKEIALSEHFQILFRQEGFLATASEPEQIFSSLREFQPDVLLLDLQKPIQNTISLVRTVRAFRQKLPIVVKAGAISQEQIRSLEEQGVTNIVSTDSTLELLAFSLKSHGKYARWVQEGRSRDFVSGVYRYAPFMEAMETELKWASRSGKSMSVAVFGLDNMDRLNREVGEREVDRLTEALCRLIEGPMQRRDRIGQVGGGSYAGFFTALDAHLLERVFLELQQRFSRLSFFHEKGEITATFSAGISRFPNLSDRHNLFEAALDAMLRAIRSGGNRIISTF